MRSVFEQKVQPDADPVKVLQKYHGCRLWCQLKGGNPAIPVPVLAWQKNPEQKKTLIHLPLKQVHKKEGSLEEPGDCPNISGDTDPWYRQTRSHETSGGSRRGYDSHC